MKNIKSHVKEWNVDIVTPKTITFARLGGLSNAVWKAKINPEGTRDLAVRDQLKKIEPQTLLYRYFKCALSNKEIERDIFEVLSETGQGPKLYFQNEKIRIESFFLSRPLTIFEMRNEIFMRNFGQQICDFNYN